MIANTLELRYLWFTLFILIIKNGEGACLPTPPSLPPLQFQSFPGMVSRSETSVNTLLDTW